MAMIRLKHIVQDRDRHGNLRTYVRSNGRKTRLREEPGSEAFMAEYHAALAAEPESVPRRPGQMRPGTWRWLIAQYVGSAAFVQLAASTRRARRRVLEATCAEPIFPGAPQTYADFPLDRLTAKALRVLRDRKGVAGLPEAANSRVKAIHAMMAWAVAEEHIEADPSRDVTTIAARGGGHHTWTDVEVAQFEARHPVGTKARLALALFLFTGVRRSDAVRLGLQHVVTDETGARRLRFRPVKTERAGVAVEIPILAELDRIIAASPTGDLHYLVTEWGRPFAPAGFGNWFRARCNEAGLPHCSAHGLRKAGATRAAEGGATAHQLMAIFGWLTLAEAERYTKAAQRRRLAHGAMHLLERSGTTDEQ